MRKLRVRREPVLHTSVLVGLLFLRFALCYPAAVARGWPPLEPFWMVSIYFTLLGVGVPALFDDFVFAPRLRHILLTTFSVAATFLVCVTWANGEVRPSIGHLAGYMAVIHSQWIMILVWSFCMLIVTLPFVFGCEIVFRGFWDRIREFSPARPSRMGTGGLLRLVIAIGILCGAIKFVISIDPRYFSRPFLMH
jgi:hypothetical protein